MYTIKKDTILHSEMPFYGIIMIYVDHIAALYKLPRSDDKSGQIKESFKLKFLDRGQRKWLPNLVYNIHTYILVWLMVGGVKMLQHESQKHACMLVERHMQIKTR